MNRRQVLTAALAFTLPRPGWASPVLPPIRVSADRIVRTTVGFRPYRPTGPRVEAERLDQKWVVHHYGHGGAGMSLAWGTARLAADLVAAHRAPPGPIAILGAGVVGLCTARQLQRAGYAVTLYAQALPHETTSARSLATWSPTSALVDEGATDATFERRFRTASALALGELHRHAIPRYGVAWRDAYTLRHSPSGAWRHRLAELAPPIAERALDHNPFLSEHTHVTVRPTLRIAPEPYLLGLLADVRAAGGHLRIRTFSTLDDVLALRERVIVNCTGLGAGPLFDDRSLIPIKGQLTVLRPQREVRYCISSISTPSGSFFYMIPRPDGIVLGGTAVYGDASPEVDEEAVARVLQAHQTLFQR